MDGDWETTQETVYWRCWSRCHLHSSCSGHPCTSIAKALESSLGRMPQRREASRTTKRSLRGRTQLSEISSSLLWLIMLHDELVCHAWSGRVGRLCRGALVVGLMSEVVGGDAVAMHGANRHPILPFLWYWCLYCWLAHISSLFCACALRACEGQAMI